MNVFIFSEMFSGMCINFSLIFRRTIEHVFGEKPIRVFRETIMRI